VIPDHVAAWCAQEENAMNIGTTPRLPRILRLALLAATLAPAAAAQVDLFSWTLFEDPGYPSSSFVVNGDQLVFSGPWYPDPCFTPGADGYAFTTAPFDATVAVKVGFFPDDPPGFDWPIYVIDGVTHAVPEPCGGCDIVFTVTAGQQFGFGNHSKDCLFIVQKSAWSQLRLFPTPSTTEVFGAAPHESLGSAVASIGDVDLDGVPDVAVGAPLASPGGVSSGRVAVLSGADASPLFVAPGVAGEQLGAAVAAAGDLNGDTIPDFIAGAPRATTPAGPQTGRAYLISGAGGGVIATLSGSAAGEHFGWSVASTGDVNGDGTPDVLVGAPDSTANGPASGYARLVSGSTRATLLTISGAGSDRCGFSVAGAGDLDGDGQPDLLVGSPGAAGNVPLGGKARAHSSTSGAVLHTFSGTTVGGQLGWSVAGLGDVDQDGVRDIAVGAPSANGVGTTANAGSASVYSGATGGLLQAVGGGQTGDRLGASVADAGDADGDGVSDVLVGAPGAGNVVPFGNGTARIVSGRDFAMLHVFAGAQPGDALGTSVAGAGDLDGDGLADALVGTPGDDTGGGSAGATSTHAMSFLLTKLGFGLAGTLGAPDLSGKGLLVSGAPLTLTVSGALPSAPAFLVLGLSQLAAPFKGGVLWPAPLSVTGGFTIGPAGTLVLVAPWPSGIPGGFNLYLQDWIVDAGGPQGFAATNALRLTTP
jgi:hypothetical protein